jgi:hypothetical protein
MGTATEKDIRRFFDRYFATWNDHDKDAFLEAWRAIASDVSAEDPVGTPLRRGWEECVIGPWDLMNSVVTMNPEHLFVCGNEAGW